MKLYDENGWFNARSIVNSQAVFSVVIGGRGTGKTYSTLKYLVENNIKFILMRRTQSQLDLLNKNEFSPFRAICNDAGYNIVSKPVSKYNSAFYMEEDGNIVSEALGYTMALSTVANLRGFDASDVEVVVFDEFIAEKHERQVKNEFEALCNAYETINRNRELKSCRAVKLVMLSNSNSLNSDILFGLCVIDKLVSMNAKGQEYSYDSSRALELALLNNSVISESKKETALYKLAKDTRYYSMSIDNDYAYDDFSCVINQNLKEYKPMFTIDGLTVYRNKGETKRWYVSKHLSGTVPEYTDPNTVLLEYRGLKIMYLLQMIYFESFECKSKFSRLFNC